MWISSSGTLLEMTLAFLVWILDFNSIGPVDLNTVSFSPVSLVFHEADPYLS